MPRYLVCAVLFAGLAAPELCAAQDSPTPGVTNVAPGVREIDGSKVPSVGIDVGALEAIIKEKKSLSAVRDVLQGDGVTSIGPAGTTVHIYKAHDTVSAKNLVLILFVKGDVIVDHLVQWV
jgi:hypothetical protein